ncbi:MAG: hypothetical protein WCD16_14500 [Paracoccaceae bacterium]
MSFVRPELKRAILRWREVLFGGVILLAGGWIYSLGGLFFHALGLCAAALGLAVGYVAWRRLRFLRGGEAPGVVEVTEGQITYLAAADGGFAALSEVTEITLAFNAAGRPCWRIRQEGGPPLSIPAAASGAEALFDAFVALPGAEPARILAALDRTPASGAVTVWRRKRRLALT